jgi:hypothetical protein
VASLTVETRILHVGGADHGTALEVDFLESLIPLFNTSYGTARCDLEVVYCMKPDRLLRYLFDGWVELVHLAAHGTANHLFVGDHERLSRRDITRHAKDNGEIGAVIVSTACELGTEQWAKCFLDAGATAYVASKREVTEKDAAIFSAAFYSAYFGTIHKGKSQAQRAFDSYRLAYGALRSFVPSTAASNKFYFWSNERVRGRKHLAPMKLA